MGLETSFMYNNRFEAEQLPASLEKMIDEAISRDFLQVLPITDNDRKNDMYKAIKFSFDAARVELLYQRKVISIDQQSLVIPHEQFLFGFHPTDGFCVFTQKKQHKIMLCDGPVRELAKQCPLTQSLQYVLVPLNAFKVWSYIPVCCQADDTCPVKSRPLILRRNLFENE